MRTVLAAFSAIISGLLVVYWVAPETFAPKDQLPIIKSLGGDFELLSTQPVQGDTAKLSDYYGNVILLNFGFTYCPDICPAVLGKIKVITEQLDPKGEKITPVFVSFDSERDSIKRLTEYLGFFNPNIVGMVAEQKHFAKLHEQYKLLVEKEEVKGSDNYNFAHTDFIYLIDQQGHVRALFSFNDSLDEIKTKVSKLL